MKGYNPPKAFELGLCFICKKECEKTSYAHYECCLAYSEEKSRRIKEANESNNKSISN